MINPLKITDYKRNEWDLQAFFFFAVAVQGKNSMQTARKVQDLLDHISEMFVENPFYEKYPTETGVIHYLLGEHDEGEACLNLLKEFKFGKYNQWEKLIDWFRELKWYYLDKVGLSIGDWLREASVEKLEWIPSVGKKTSRFFKLHSDPEVECVPLDTHILKYVRERYDAYGGGQGFRIPKTTPQSPYDYRSLERIALEYLKDYAVQNNLKTLAQADLAIWSSYAS